jgi:hypothetical protein
MFENDGSWQIITNSTEETEKDAEVYKSDYVYEDTNDLDKLRLSKMKAGKASPRVQSNLMKMLLMKFMSFD